jgi:hypothetical protein
MKIIILTILICLIPSWCGAGDMSNEAKSWLDDNVTKIDTGHKCGKCDNKLMKWDYVTKDGLRTYRLKNGKEALEVIDKDGNKFLEIDGAEMFVPAETQVIDQ